VAELVLGVGLGGGLPPLIVIVIVSMGWSFSGQTPVAVVGAGHVCGAGAVLDGGLARGVVFGGTYTPSSICDQLSGAGKDDVLLVLVLVLDLEPDPFGALFPEAAPDSDEVVGLGTFSQGGVAWGLWEDVEDGYQVGMVDSCDDPACNDVRDDSGGVPDSRGLSGCHAGTDDDEVGRRDLEEDKVTVVVIVSIEGSLGAEAGVVG
jgi:hypothetical protein